MYQLHLGDLNIPVVDSALFFVLILSLIFNTFLFRRGEGNYSIKYELMRNQQFFRQHMFFTYVIQIIYKFFFLLPFLLLITLSVLAAIRDINSLAPILINGLIIILILYPTKSLHYYYKLFAMWLLATGSQLSTFFIHEVKGDQAYYILSTIFYTGNIFFYYLALISIQNVYWEISEAVKEIPEQVNEVNQKWLEGQIPKTFDGGLYGYFYKNKYHYFQFTILYLISLVFLGVYAFLVHWALNSNLGIVGLVSAIIYDIFVQIFNSLDHKGRSLKSVYIVLVASRFLSFVFGIQNWLMGYCVLYFFVSIFMGWIIIDKHFPLKQENKKQHSRKYVNALKTPQFALLALSVQIIIMILVQAYALDNENPQLIYNNVSIPIWQWGILAVIGAWVIITYMVSVRVLLRHKYKIVTLTSYYFGVSKITEYHIYLGTSYLLLIALGVYGQIYLKEKLILVCCIFLPLIYLCLLGFGVSWSSNQYMILADIEQYNKITKKKYQSKKKRAQMMAMNQQLKDKKKQFMMGTVRAKRSGTGTGIFGGFKDFVGSMGLVPDAEQQYNQKKSENQGDITDNYINVKPTNSKSAITLDNVQIQEFIQLKDWKDPNQNVSCGEVWKCLTPNDKRIIFSAVSFVLLSVGYCLTSMLWARNKFAISLIVCVISYLTLIPYVKFYKTRGQMLIAQIIGGWIGFALGIIYWSVFNSEIVGPIAFSICHMIISLFLLINCYKTELNIKVLISPALQILLNIIFIQITLALHTTIIESLVFALVFFIFIVLQVPLYYQLVHQHIPKPVIIVSALIIGAAAIVLSILGYIKEILSSLAIFSIIMSLIFIAFFSTAIIMYINKKLHEEEQPSIYCAYGPPHYQFNSAKEKLKLNNIPLIMFQLAMSTLVIYSGIVSFFFNAKYWAVFGLSLFWLLQIFINMQVSMSSYIFIGKYKNQKLLTKQIILDSFKKLKDQYMVEQMIGQSSSDFFIKLKQIEQKAKESNDAKDWKEVLTYHDLWVKNLKQQELFLIFWTGLIIFNLMGKKRQIISQTLAELKQIQDELISNGIILQCLQLPLKPKQKYEKAMREIESLQPVDFIIYEEILAQHRAQKNENQKQIDEMHEKQKREIQKRNQQLYNQMKNNQIVDSKDQIYRFQQIIKQLGRKNLFFDEQFPANETILGERLNQIVTTWRRPNVGQVLTKSQKIASDQVKQGKIGDCYLISSFGVLGQKRIKQALGYDSQGKEIWINTKGAFMIKFFKFGKEMYIIIDDLLPVNQQDEWVFAKSQDPTQYWPCILQKAYAKLYGGYNKIIEGKCHQVMAEFTGGFPFEIILEQYKSNPNGLWNRIITSKKNGYLIASGSPPNPQGDSASSKRGIVQGHAYSVLDAKEIDEYKLIKLKNPHGSAGKEWNGDFSDKSDLMTKRMLGLLEHSRSDDGIFWMTIQDFLIQFKSLYICAVFDERWKKLGPYQGKWTDENSFGTPNYPGSQNNPHYGLQVHKKCTMFISLTQDAISALKGKNYIFMKALKNKGKRITPEAITPQNSIGRPKKPTDAVTISLQLQLQAESYPYTFSLMVSCDAPGKTGSYSIQAYCDDKEAKIIDDSVFDIQK